jgi:Tfp pilus assembly protein FimV
VIAERRKKEAAMSVATEWEPIVDIPERARRTQRTAGPRPRPLALQGPPRLASVTTLYRPPAVALVPRLRLTRRGVHVVAAAVAVLAIGLVLLARASVPAGSAAGASAPARMPDVVTVRAGDTLWSIASRLAPQRDPRAEIAELQRLNRLGSAALVPGQVLRTH